MEAEEALQLISGGEGQRVELKTSFAEEEEAFESLGAFTNASGGTVFIGIKPDRSVGGVHIGRNTLENFSNRLRDNSEPPIYPQLDRLELQGKTVVSATIGSAAKGQVHHVHNKALIRVGSTNQVMSPAEYKARLMEGIGSDVAGGVSAAVAELEAQSYEIGKKTYSALEVFERIGKELLQGKSSFSFRADVARAFDLSPSNLVNEQPILEHWMLIGIVDTPERVQPAPRSGPDSNVARPEEPYDRYSLSALGKKTLNEMRKGGSKPIQPVVLWPDRAGAPQFAMRPNIHEGRLLCEFYVLHASPAPGGVEAKWLGAGTNMDWTRLEPRSVPRDPSSQKYKMKPTEMAPTPPSDQVMLEIRFNLEDGPHGGRWTWPMHQHESKGHWILDSHLGSGTNQPSLDDAW